MADTYTLQLGFQQPQVNADAGVWGGYLNTDLQAIDDAIAGFVVINLTGLTSYTLTAVPGSEGVNYQQRYQVWVFTGALTGTCTVNIGAKQKVGYVYNQTTGGHSVILTTGVGGGGTVDSAACLLLQLSILRWDQRLIAVDGKLSAHLGGNYHWQPDCNWPNSDRWRNLFRHKRPVLCPAKQQR